MSGSPSSVASQISDNVLRDRTQDFPPEIMSRIFTLACDGKVFLPAPYSGLPWFIGYVCSRWRQILWGTPSIWTKILIGYLEDETPKFNSEGYTDGSVEGLDIGDALRYILSKHSSTVSLTVAKFGSRYMESLIYAILEHFHRFSEVLIYGLAPSELSSIFKLPTSAFAQLERLDLSSLWIDGDFLPRATPPFQTAPILRSVTYEITSPHYVPSLLLLPWATIEHISMRGMRIAPDMILHIFRSCPSLKLCCLFIDTTCTISHTPDIILPALETLSLQTPAKFNWRKFLSVVTAPALETLTIIAPHVPCAPVASLIARSLCPVVDLNIDSVRVKELDDDEGVKLLLDHVPSLANLVVPWSIPPSIFRKIHTGAFPHLVKAVVFVGPDGLGAFLDMVDTYINPPRRWPGDLTITIKCCEGPGLVEQENRYMANGDAYDSVEGLIVTIFNFNYSTVRPLGM